MKKKGFYVLATAAMLALSAGCGSNQGEENPQNQITDAVMVTDVPEATATPEPTATPAPTATPEPTATPAPTATPIPANYMEANGIEVLGAGWHTCKGFIANEWDENDNPILELADLAYCMEVTEVENDGITKVIEVELHAKPYVNEDGGRSGEYIMAGFVDLKTGKSFLPVDINYLQTTFLKRGEEAVGLQLAEALEFPSVTYPYYTERFALECPADYEDAGFYLTGYTYDWEAYTERADTWKMLNYIRHGESDMAVFGVNKCLATEPEKTVPGAELAEENYLEANGYSVKGEGTYTWLGTEALRKWNEETRRWESVSLEENEITTTISITEESLGDGTKMIKGTFIETLYMVSEDEVKIPYKKWGIADKKTGLVYCPRTYRLAEPYVLEKDGEEITIFVGMEIVEEELGDGKVDSRTTFTLVCPEDYNDGVFYLTADVDIDEDEHLYSNEPEVYSLNEIEHGDYEFMFFQ